MKDLLKITKDISFPRDFVTQTVAILAKRRSGKSYTMRRITEQLLEKGDQVVVVDPKGDQWGIRSSADGKLPGFPVIIFGGEHGDVPLEVGAGELVAKLVVEERVNILLDLSQFRKHEVATFMTHFLENLYRLKAQEKYRTPVMVVCDEADAIAPQKPQKGEERMLGAIEDIVRRGGQRGIGCVLVTQRSAVLNKNVLTQAEILIVLRTIAPQDLAAMRAWIDVHGTEEQAKELMASLPSLPIGDAWFWSPGWPTAEGIFKRSRALPIQTFDSGATPKPGEKKVVPKSVADVDLESLKVQMAATIEKARADDPKELRKEVARLQKQIAVNAPVPASDDTKSVIRARAEADREWRGKLHGAEKSIASLMRGLQQIGKIVSEYSSSPAIVVTLEQKIVPSDVIHPGGVVRMDPRDVVREIDGSLSTPEQKVVDAIAWFRALNLNTPSKISVAFLAGYSGSSGGYNNLCGQLRTKGIVEYVTPGTISLTASGSAFAAEPDIPPTREGLHDAVLRKLPAPEGRVLTPLLEAYPDSLSSEELATKAQYEPSSGGFNNLKGRLRSLGLAEYPSPGRMKAADILFP